MIGFQCDYQEGAHERILERLLATNREQTVGYGEDEYCQRAAKRIAERCSADVDVHFFVGGTQANFTLIAGALRAHQAALCATTGHINVHESGAVEATGHKVIALPTEDGKLTAKAIDDAWRAHWEDGTHEHMAQPALVYLSDSTELGTVYTKAELTAISEVCKARGMLLYVDGARLGYALTCAQSDLTLADLARLCDAFYIGGTKQGALFGEAMVLVNPLLKRDFRYILKQRGAMLAKGRLLGIQFDALFEDDLYFELSRHANAQAARIREALAKKGVRFLAPSPTNQIFPILSDGAIAALSEKYRFAYIQRVDENHSAIRFCTSWASREEDVSALIADLEALL